MKLKTGDIYSKEFSISNEDIRIFSEITGDKNPIHLNVNYAKKSGFMGPIAHGLLTSSIFSRILGNEFPGQGTIYLKQELNFCSVVYPDEKLIAEIVVLESNDKGKYRLKTMISSKNKKENIKITGEAIILYNRKD